MNLPIELQMQIDASAQQHKRELALMAWEIRERLLPTPVLKSQYLTIKGNLFQTVNHIHGNELFTLDSVAKAVSKAKA